MPSAPSTEQWEQLWLPLWPYASDELWHGIYRTSRGNALGRRYIQSNPDAISNLLVVDIDHSDAFLRAVSDRHGWTPNAVVENRRSGHAHAVWAIAEPVVRTEYGRRKPLAYAAAIVEGLRRSVDGDKGYSGFLTKNPTHTAWSATWLTDQLYSLPDLDARLAAAHAMPPPSWQRAKRANPIGLGRNCTIFETARIWAYRRVRDCPDRTPASSAYLHDAIVTEVHTLNTGFSEPLPTNEAAAIARSIHRWITRHSRMWADGPAVYEATLSTIQAARGRKGAHKAGTASGLSRQGDKRERVQAAIGDTEVVQ